MNQKNRGLRLTATNANDPTTAITANRDANAGKGKGGPTT